MTIGAVNPHHSRPISFFPTIPCEYLSFSPRSPLKLFLTFSWPFLPFALCSRGLSFGSFLSSFHCPLYHSHTYGQIHFLLLSLSNETTLVQCPSSGHAGLNLPPQPYHPHFAVHWCSVQPATEKLSIPPLASVIPYKCACTHTFIYFPHTYFPSFSVHTDAKDTKS